MITFGMWLRHRLAKMAGEADGIAAHSVKDDPMLTQLAADLRTIRELIEDDREARFVEKWRQQQAVLLLLGGLTVIAAIILLPINPAVAGHALGADRTWVVQHVDRTWTILGVIVGFGAILVGWLAQPQWLWRAQLATTDITILIGWPYLAVRHGSFVTLPVMQLGALVLVGAQPPDRYGRARVLPNLSEDGVGAVLVAALVSLLLGVWLEFAIRSIPVNGFTAFLALAMALAAWFGAPAGVYALWRLRAKSSADLYTRRNSSTQSR